MEMVRYGIEGFYTNFSEVSCAMLRIGAFSILSSISIHMLRHYDEIGLLTPDSTDPVTGYRYYREEQLSAANRIIALKRMGFGLKEIGEFILCGEDEERLKQLLHDKAKNKVSEIRRLENQLFEICNTICETEPISEFAGSIAVKDIPRRQVVSYRSRIQEYSQEGRLWTALFEEGRNHKISYSDLEYNVAVLYGIDPDRNDIDVEVQKTIDHYSGSGGRLEFKIVEPVTVASLICRGGYSLLKDVNEAVAKWILQNRYEPCGNLFNIYHVSPEGGGSEDNFVTEVCFPVKKIE